MEKDKSVPTGCFKCGRPGHWSRDCPSSDPISNSSNPNPNPKSNTNYFKSNFNSSRSTFPSSSLKNGAFDAASRPVGVDKSSEKPKKVAVSRSRPKLTPELFLSDDGLGYVLRHFPRAFKYRGRGNEVRDLGNLLGLYSEWHSHLIPYYSFDQFVHKVEQVASTKRVKTCLRELRERVASGGDPTKLHEPPTERSTPNEEQATTEAINSEDLHGLSPDADDVLNKMHQEAYEKAAWESSQTLANDTITAPDQVRNDITRSSESQITEEQRARMEANRLRALEKAKARGHVAGGLT